MTFSIRRGGHIRDPDDSAAEFLAIRILHFGFVVVDLKCKATTDNEVGCFCGSLFAGPAGIFVPSGRSEKKVIR